MEVTYKRPQSEVKCNYCNDMFLKDNSEIKRSNKNNKPHYCSLSCTGKVNSKRLKPYQSKKGELKNIKPGSLKDEFSLFRPHLRRALRRKHACNITLEDMKSQWDAQEGKCVYSNVVLTKTDEKEKNNPLYTMSLDRINSSIGNVQFISIAMNHMKSSMSESQVEELLQILKD